MKLALAPLSIRSFRRLYAAQVCSDMGNWLDLIAVSALVVYHWHMGAAAIAAVTVTYAIPWIVFGPFAAVWTERMSSKLIMIAANLIRALAVVLMLVAPNLILLLPLLFVKEAMGAMFDPARQSALRQLVPDDQMAEAVSLSQLSANSTKVIAPVLGGSIIALFGARSPFVVELAIFLLSALALTRLPHLHNGESDNGDQTDSSAAESFLARFQAGLRHIFTVQTLAIAVIMSSISLFIVFLYDGLLSIWTQEKGFDESQFGLLIGAVGLGSVAGAAAMAQLTFWRRRPLLNMCVTTFFSGSLTILSGLGGMNVVHLSFAFWAVSFFAAGVCGASFSVPFGFILQMTTPARLMSRVSSSANAFQNAAMLASPITGAALAASIGVGGVLVAAGCCTIALASAFLYPVLKQASIGPIHNVYANQAAEIDS